MRFFPRFSLVLALAAGVSHGMPVEASHPVAGFLRRLEEKGVVAIGFWSTLPRDDHEVAGVLKQAEAKKTSLGAWDRRRLEKYLGEFDPERRRSQGVLHYGDSVLMLRGDAEFFTGVYLRDSVPQADLTAFGSLTPRVHAEYREWAYLTSSITVGSERSYHPRFASANYDPQAGLPYNNNRIGTDSLSQTVSTFDGFRMVMGVGDSRLRLEIGQDWNEWGPGHWQHTTLSTHPFFWVSDSLAANPAVGFNGTQNPGTNRRGYRYPGEGPPLPQIRFKAGTGNWEYVKIVAERKGLWNDSSALLVAHRLQVRLGSWRFGATEMLAIGTRAPAAVYFLPVIPLKWAEHEGGDLDNVAMSVDAEWIWAGVGRVYGELFLDDFSGPPLNYYGNKFATVAGLSLQDPFGLPSEVHVEYAEVDPWVYSHRLINTAMQSYGSLLGSSLPPNSRAISASVEFPVADGLNGLVEWNFRQRDLKSRGSSIFDVFTGSDNKVKQFLVSDVETRNHLTLSADWSWRRFVQLTGGGGWLWVTNFRGNTAKGLSTPSLFAEVRVRY